MPRDPSTAPRVVLGPGRDGNAGGAHHPFALVACHVADAALLCRRATHRLDGVAEAGDQLPVLPAADVGELPRGERRAGQRVAYDRGDVVTPEGNRPTSMTPVTGDEYTVDRAGLQERGSGT